MDPIINDKQESPSNSQASFTYIPSPPSHPLDEEVKEVDQKEAPQVAMEIGSSSEPPNKPNLVNDGFQNFTSEEISKYQKYEADFANYLRAKYFSNKDAYGGDIFDLTVSLGDETIKASRSSPTRSYAEPAKSSELTSGAVASATGTPSKTDTVPNVSNGGMTTQKTN